MNKQDIISNINTKIDDGGSSTAEEVRGVLSVDDNSLLEAVYSDAVLDSHVLQTYTVSNSNAEYRIDIFKNANTTTIKGAVTILSNTSDLVVFEVSDNDFKGDGVGFAINTINSESRSFRIRNAGLINSQVVIDGSLLSGQVYRCSITYNSLN